jgi:predicted TIM-barrel fold metal-dependent hydrolase
MVFKSVDADSHILEPGDLWEKNIEPEYRDRAIRLLKDADGVDYIDMDGKSSPLLPKGTLAELSAAGQPAEDLGGRFRNGTIGYEEARSTVAPGAKDPHERIKLMDSEGTDVTLLYPSIGLSSDAIIDDPKLAAAHSRVYNDWIVDFCGPYPDRLIPVAHIPMLDIDEAVKEFRRAAKMGMKSLFFSIWPPKGRSFGDTYYDPLWAEAQDAEIPIAIHVINASSASALHQFPTYVRAPGITEWYFEVMLSLDVVTTFTAMLNGGTLERFPNLQVALLESGCGWIAHWLDRMDEFYERDYWDTPMKMKPSEYFARQCSISMEPDEKTIPAMAQIVGADKIMWASDYPHSEGHVETLSLIKERVKPLPTEDQQKILGENALKLYKLG